MLRQLAGALGALGDKLRVQQDAAVDVCSLGVRAEEIARAARTLAFERRQDTEAPLAALSAEIAALASEMQATAERAEQDSLMGRAVADALNRHAGDLDALAELGEQATDMAAIRARLRPLAVTLQEVPQRMQAGKAQGAELGALAERSRLVAAQAAALQERSVPGRQEKLIQLSRGLGQLAEDTVRVAARFTEDATVAVSAADGMASRTRGLSKAAGGDPTAASVAELIRAGMAAQARLDDAGTAGPAAETIAWTLDRRPV